MDEFTGSAEAFRVARERASVATYFADSTLHTAVHDAREAGLSVREAAAALRVPKSTVARHWKEHHTCRSTLPIWGSMPAWQDAHAAVWAHDPEQLADDWVPFTWEDDEDGNRRVAPRPRGVARLNQEGGPVLVLDENERIV